MALLVISYSRRDQRVIRAVVKLLQTAFRDVIDKTVYWDEDFEPGEPWFKQIKLYIDAAPQLFVFWCNHSSFSTQVRREFRYALKKRKRVVPLLLDDTPLHRQLKSIHAIDLRDAINHHLRQNTFPGLSLKRKGKRKASTANWLHVKPPLASVFRYRSKPTIIGKFSKYFH